MSVEAGHTSHKLAWYYGYQERYSDILDGEAVVDAKAYGGLVEIRAGNASILFGEGVNIRFHDSGAGRPPRHQFLLDFEDGSALSAAVQMYGGIGAFITGELDNPYYLVAKQKPSPFSEGFDLDHFRGIAQAPEAEKLSLKALLATEQRIPGLGNGALQDILFNSKMHPRRRIGTLSEKDIKTLFSSLKGTLESMAEQGGRDTEADIFGRRGGYCTILSKNTVGKPCPVCMSTIKKEAYMGGTVYFCDKCQTR